MHEYINNGNSEGYITCATPHIHNSRSLTKACCVTKTLQYIGDGFRDIPQLRVLKSLSEGWHDFIVGQSFHVQEVCVHSRGIHGCAEFNGRLMIAIAKRFLAYSLRQISRPIHDWCCNDAIIVLKFNSSCVYSRLFRTPTYSSLLIFHNKERF